MKCQLCRSKAEPNHVLCQPCIESVTRVLYAWNRLELKQQAEYEEVTRIARAQKVGRA